MSAPTTLTEAGIKLPRANVGWHGTACPECARSKARPRDDALGVEIMPDGGARWSCRRCAWAGWVALFTCETCGWQSYRHERACGACGWEPGKATARRQENPPRRDRSPPRPTPPPETPPRPGGFPDTAAALWRSCRPIGSGDLAAAYLEHRGCALPHPEGDLRWHPELRHPSGHVGPALVALVTDAVTVEPMTVHRTWLAEDGRGKAAIDKPRLLWPGAPKAGGVIRLWPDAEVTLGLAVGEGIETSLALARGFGLAWACIDAGNLAALPVLGGIEAITIAADHDEAGIKAARACAERWAAAGREVRIILPEAAGADLADEAAA